jgi:nicotinamide-nucleotide amidase
LKIELITIGDELLLGFTIDTNAAWLARELASIGVEVVRRTTCGDTFETITDAVQTALDRTGAVITTGGLGPTADDLTREAVASVFGVELLRDETVAEGLRALWKSRNRSGELPEVNYRQAFVPRGARVLPNARGTAPGLLLQDDRERWVAMLPGVPVEMRAMFSDTLRSIVRHKAGDGATVIASRTLRTTGVPESMLAERLGDLGHGFGGVELAYLPNFDGVDLRLTSRDRAQRDADHLLRNTADVLYDRLDDVVYGEDGADLASTVIDMCRTGNLRLGVAESCTGGLLGARITNIPGASDIFHGGFIAYDNRVKRQLLGVLDDDLKAYGAVSEPVALQMAKGARVRLGTEIGVGITGIAGPHGAMPGKPVGTVWIAIDVSEGRPPVPRPQGFPPIAPFRQARVFQFIGQRDEIRHRAAQAALDLIRRSIADLVITA